MGSRHSGDFSNRIIDIDLEIAETWGRISAERSLPVVDSLLAATALVRGMTLVTRNVRDIGSTGVALLILGNLAGVIPPRSAPRRGGRRTSGSTWLSNLTKLSWNMRTSLRAVASNSALSRQVLNG